MTVQESEDAYARAYVAWQRAYWDNPNSLKCRLFLWMAFCEAADQLEAARKKEEVS